MEILQFIGKGIFVVFGVLSLGFVMAILDEIFFAGGRRKEAMKALREGRYDEYKRLMWVVLMMIVACGSAIADDGEYHQVSQTVESHAGGTSITTVHYGPATALTPSQIYEMNGGDSQVQTNKNVPIFGSEAWHKSEANFQKHEYVDQNGVSQYFGDGNGNLITKEAYEAQVKANNDRFQGWTGKVINNMFDTASATGEEMPKENIKELEKGAKQVEQDTKRELKRIEAYKPRVLVSE